MRRPGTVPPAIERGMEAILDIVRAKLRGDVLPEDCVRFAAAVKLALEVDSVDMHLMALELANEQAARTLARLTRSTNHERTES